MDLVQFIFSFVNAPLFATFLLGMFWRRATGTGAFIGLIVGLITSVLFYGLTIAAGDTPGAKGAWITGRLTPSRARWRLTSGWPSSPSAPAC